MIRVDRRATWRSGADVDPDASINGGGGTAGTGSRGDASSDFGGDLFAATASVPESVIEQPPRMAPRRPPPPFISVDAARAYQTAPEPTPLSRSLTDAIAANTVNAVTTNASSSMSRSPPAPFASAPSLARAAFRALVRAAAGDAHILCVLPALTLPCASSCCACARAVAPLVDEVHTAMAAAALAAAPSPAAAAADAAAAAAAEAEKVAAAATEAALVATNLQDDSWEMSASMGAGAWASGGAAAAVANETSDAGGAVAPRSSGSGTAPSVGCLQADCCQRKPGVGGVDSASAGGGGGAACIVAPLPFDAITLPTMDPLVPAPAPVPAPSVAAALAPPPAPPFAAYTLVPPCAAVAAALRLGASLSPTPMLVASLGPPAEGFGAPGATLSLVDAFANAALRDWLRGDYANLMGGVGLAPAPAPASALAMAYPRAPAPPPPQLPARGDGRPALSNHVHATQRLAYFAHVARALLQRRPSLRLAIVVGSPAVGWFSTTETLSASYAPETGVVVQVALAYTDIVRIA